MTWDDFQARAKKVVPSQELKAKRCWIGVLSHEKALQDDFEEFDFVWMIGHHKISIQKIHETYQKRHEGLDFHLRFEHIIADKSDTVKSFMRPEDDLVLFLACVVEPTRAQAEDLAQAQPVTPEPPSVTSHMHPVPFVSPYMPIQSAPYVTSQERYFFHPSHGRLPIPSHIAVDNERHSPPVFHHMDEDTQVDFDPENFFNRESSPDQDSQQYAQPSDRSVRDIIAQQDPKILEAGIAQSIKVLNTLKHNFAQYSDASPDASAWTEAIEKLIPLAARKRTVVGVVGNTGAGKSSVINAMLDEERLVPTNCMRACTAVVTEMSWNESTDPLSKYIAQIEFISRVDWEKEVGILMKEFMTESGGVSREVADENSDAGIAWAKFHSVYPKITRDSLEDCTIESLISEKAVLAVLGTTKKIETATPNTFYQKLQQYVDSKEKVGRKGKDKDKDASKKKAFEIEYWPLIKVVKIYVKAPALATGAVIVDLPGVHDSNAARAAVAQGYMKQCTGLWIVAPINRAVDDKAAKNLLGDSFKRQLKYDGGFSSVTFICSKTDDISITEAIDTLELEDEVQELEDERKRFQRQIKDVQEKIGALKEEQDVYRISQKEVADEIEMWDQLKERFDEGETVYAPVPQSVKRKKSSSDNARKRRHKSDDDDDDDDDFIVSDEDDASTDDDSDSDADAEEVQAPKAPLTGDEIKDKVKQLREAKKMARREVAERAESIKQLRPQIQECKKEIDRMKADISHICIAGRNDYSKRAIQQDFAAGIKELDQENAAEEDEDNFNPDAELRDYDEVARSLPVFCVSSRAYQKMCGRMQKDDDVPGFKTPEETGMPQLQAHCTKLTEAGRIQTARTFLLSLCQQLTTFSLWASNDGAGLKMTNEDKRKQVRYLEKRLGELEKGLEEAVRACLNVLKKEMNDQIFGKYPDLIEEAINSAPVTAQNWGAHRADGGLAWATYKAIVRRDGSYHSSSAGRRDFNADLVDPIAKKLATSWERAFQNRLPKAFDAFVKASGRLLHNFHQAVEERARQNGVRLASLSALKTQIYTYEQLFADLNQVLVTLMTEQQREANRDFTPTIANIMHTVYDMCTTESGQGSFKRMKEHMSREVDRNRRYMFNDATGTVKRHLDAMCRALEDAMEEKADEIYIKMKADYMRVLGGVQVNQAEVMSKADRTLRSEIMSILRGVDAQFEPIARGELADQDSTEEIEQGLAEEPKVEVEEENAFDSARESVERDPYDDSVMEGADNTLITEPTPSKHHDIDAASDKENHALPTRSDDGMDDDEL
ncbi:hypothetical protein EK21DRAFT_62781 [Setomelanomma holmii]|uniref:Nuclear GTPase SLIP-GC n=1 Tax=Setomelanomma holmii TaxID=210430 RepID=A0A9P4HDJ9_9PLEO|nr:hypothetical protein EK21DRAFT_62781 [Setomelanomma holmii]